MDKEKFIAYMALSGFSVRHIGHHDHVRFRKDNIKIYAILQSRSIEISAYSIRTGQFKEKVARTYEEFFASQEAMYDL